MYEIVSNEINHLECPKSSVLNREASGASHPVARHHEHEAETWTLTSYILAPISIHTPFCPHLVL